MRFYRAMLWKAYFDKGCGLLNYFTKVLMVVGVGAGFQGANLNYIVGIAIGYSLFCLLLGRAWFYFKLVDAEVEVTNRVNPFVGEMRKTYKDVVPKYNN